MGAIGEIPRHRQEPSPAVRELRPGEPIPPPQTHGGAWAVVCLEAGTSASKLIPRICKLPQQSASTPSRGRDRRRQEINTVRSASLRASRVSGTACAPNALGGGGKTHAVLGIPEQCFTIGYRQSDTGWGEFLRPLDQPTSCSTGLPGIASNTSLIVHLMPRD